jgi:polar amino acid transport system substrate-binding protein
MTNGLCASDFAETLKKITENTLYGHWHLVFSLTRNILPITRHTAAWHLRGQSDDEPAQSSRCSRLGCAPPPLPIRCAVMLGSHQKSLMQNIGLPTKEHCMQLLLAVLTSILLMPAWLCAEKAQITIATSDGVPLSTPEGTGFHDQVVREAFRRIGVTPEIVHLPAERSLLNANEGIEQGVFVRVEGLEKVYPNLRRVPEKISEYEFVAFSKRTDIPINGWDSLRDYHVAIITGWKILEQNILQAQSLIKVRDASLLFQALVDDKVDLVVYNKLDGYGSIKIMGLQGIHALQAPLATRDMFLYLHSSQEKHIPGLIAALQAMKRDGTYDAIQLQSLTSYLPH